MKYLVEDCENPSVPVKTLADAVNRARAVFSDYPCVVKAVLFDFFLGLDSTCTSLDYLSLLDSLASTLGRDVDVTVKLKGATDRFVYNLKTEGRLIYDRARNRDIPSNAA